MEGIVEINVGGTVFATTASTLRSRGSNFLTRLLDYSNSPTSGLGCLRDKDSRPFVDRSPVAFAAVLDYLRGGHLHVPPALSREQLLDELEFYQIEAPAESELRPIASLPQPEQVIEGAATVEPADVVEYWKGQARVFVAHWSVFLKDVCTFANPTTSRSATAALASTVTRDTAASEWPSIVGADILQVFVPVWLPVGGSVFGVFLSEAARALGEVIGIRVAPEEPGSVREDLNSILALLKKGSLYGFKIHE
eukprot:m51a1_g2637 putative k+ channel tetramerisation subfamily protein (252) ;mRNA; r:586117-587156